MDTPRPALLIYLFADAFLPPAGGPLSQFALAPRTAERLDLKKLVVRLYTAVFMDLVYSDALRLLPGQVRRFLGSETALLAELRPAGVGSPVDDLAGQILGRWIPNAEPAQNRVRELVIRQIGGRKSTAAPWLDALSPFITEAVRCGYAAPPEKQPPVLARLFSPSEARTRLEPDLDRIDPLRSAAVEANGRLDQFLAYQGEAGELLPLEIESGVSACQRSRDFD